MCSSHAILQAFLSTVESALRLQLFWLTGDGSTEHNPSIRNKQKVGAYLTWGGRVGRLCFATLRPSCCRRGPSNLPIPSQLPRFIPAP